jgi:hypothetical protein
VEEVQDKFNGYKCVSAGLAAGLELGVGLAGWDGRGAGARASTQEDVGCNEEPLNQGEELVHKLLLLLGPQNLEGLVDRVKNRATR